MRIYYSFIPWPGTSVTPKASSRERRKRLALLEGQLRVGHPVVGYRWRKPWCRGRILSALVIFQSRLQRRPLIRKGSGCHSPLHSAPQSAAARRIWSEWAAARRRRRAGLSHARPVSGVLKPALAIHCSRLWKMTLIQTAKLNGIEPMTWLTDVLERVVSGQTKAHELHTLLPWNWRATGDADRPPTD